MQSLSRHGDSGGFQLDVPGRRPDAPIHRVGAPSHRRLDLSASSTSRRPSQLTPYKLKCEKEPLSGRIGPPDFHPQTPNCPEETLTREYLQTGYKDTVEGIEEAREIGLSQIGSFSKPIIQKCKEALKKRLKAINDSRAQKRKAGQVYGVPLSGPLLTKPGVFPEQRPYGEESRKKWIEGLSQPHKRLRSLADHVPHGFKKNALLDVLIRHNVPLLRATWFVKVNILNQNKSGSDKTYSNRTDQWTKIVIENLKYLLDDFLSKDGTSPVPSREQSSQSLLSGLPQNRSDTISLFSDGEEPTVQYNWWYMVRILQWHFAEGLLSPAPIIEWVFAQIQEKESLEALELLLPIVVNVIEKVALSQTFVCIFLDIAVRAINALNPGGIDPPSDARKSHLSSALCEMLRYLILAVPDTFVTLDAFPLPTCVLPDVLGTRNAFPKIPENTDMAHYGSRDAYHRCLSFGHVVSSLHRRAVNLAKVASPNIEGHGVAKVVQALDKALLLGDVRGAYSCLFEEQSDVTIEEGWIADVSPSLWSSLKWIGSVSMSMICAVFFLCEWAACDYRDFRTSLPQGVKFTGRKDLSRVYFAVTLLKLRIEEMQSSSWYKNGSLTRSNGAKADPSDVLQSPGPFHDIIVCWLDRHEIGKGEGFKCLQVLIMELIYSGIFCPHAYVRQLIVSGIMDTDDTSLKLNRQKRHYRILKQLPGSYLFDVLKEAKIAEASVLNEVVHVYANERRLVLHGLSNVHPNRLKIGNDGFSASALERVKGHLLSAKDGDSSSFLEHWKNDSTGFSPLFAKHTKMKHRIAELKNAILAFLNIPGSALSGTKNDEFHGKRALGSLGNKMDVIEGSAGCEECRRVKRQKLNDEKGLTLPGITSNPSDDEDSWWVRKGAKSVENLKVEPTLKSTKHASRGRRKTQSLAQLAAARIEGSQGASTSHVCENKLTCPHHKSVVDGEIPRASDGIKTAQLRDVGKALKQLRLLEKKSIIIWLLALIRQLVEGNEKAFSKPNHGNGPFSPPDDERTAVRWKLGEDELSSTLYLLDISCDLFSAVKFLLWLLPRVLGGPVSSGHVGRNILMLSKNKDIPVIDVGEVFLLSSLQRYENILVAAELLPEALTAAMQRAASGMTSNGRSSCSPAFTYVKKLLKKYADLPSVVKWEKNFRGTCDPRLLAELEAGRSLEVDVGYSLGVPTGVEDLDDYIRQKIIGSGRVSRTSLGMKEIVQRYVEEAVHYSYGKDKKLFAATNTKNSTVEKYDDDYHVAQQIVSGLLECIRQNGGATQDDLFSVSSAVSAIVSNVGPAIAASCNYQSPSLSESTLSCVRRIIHIHISSLCYLKEAFGERLSRIFEIVLAAEASSTVSGAFAPGKVSRQFQLSPETHDMNSNISSEVLNAKVFVGRAVKTAAAVSALVVGAIIHGISSLERMITVLKLKEGLDVMHFIRSSRSNSNGISRSSNAFKFDNSVEVYVHWFRVLIGNCRTVFDGLVADMLGESYILAFSRMQRLLPLNLVFPPAYSIFGLVIWRPYILMNNIASREDIQLYQCLTLAIGDALKHQPFRDLCLRDTHVLYDILASDAGDSEFAAMFEIHSSDKHLKTMAFVLLRARLFLNAMIDCKMPPFTIMRDDGTWVSVQGEQRSFESETKLLDELVHVLDTIQPAKFHWQWVMLRLLLNEQAFIEKIESRSMSLVEAIRSLYPNAENSSPSENESSFTENVLTRLLVRPDAAPLYSEVLHLLGRSLEDKLLLHVKWLLGGNDVLFGRKSIRQRLINFAQPRGLSTKAQFCKPWGWSSSAVDMSASRADKGKVEISTLEEGEVVDEGMDIKRFYKLNSSQLCDVDLLNSNQQFTTERALAELVLPCIDRSSSEARITFASELVKQICLVDQHINSLTCGAKHGSVIQSGVENSSNKSSNRKGIRGGSPGMGRRPTGATDSVPPSTGALKASMWLRLQFILRSVPIIYIDRDPSIRSLRHTLASVILHFLGTRIVYEDADISFSPIHKLGKRDVELPVDASFVTSLDLAGESLFNMFLSVFHGLLSGCKPSWLKLNSSSKSTSKTSRDFCAVDRDLAEHLQTELDRMYLPLTIRKRIQAAMPMLPPSPPLFISCHPPVSSSSTLTASLHPSSSTPGFQQASSNHSQRSLSSSRPPTGARNRQPLPQDADSEIDPWTLLEDGTGSSSTSGNGTDISGVSSDHSNLKACSWLKGAVRVRRTDLTYIGAVDEDN